MKKIVARYWRRVLIKLERFWYKLVTLKSSPRKIALGFALGVVIAYTPTFGIQTILVFSLSALFRVNPISATVGVYISNPITIVPMYALCYKVGAFILRVDSNSHALDFSRGMLSVSKRGLSWIGVEFVGALVVGAISFPIAYYVALWVVVRYRRARLNRRIKRMRERLEDEGDDTGQKSEAMRDASSED